MIVLVAASLGGMGLICVLIRRTYLGLLIGLQLMFLGASMAFVLAGVASGARPTGHIFGFFVIVGSIAQLIGGYSLAIRRFFLRSKVNLDEMWSLKQ